MSGTNKEWGVTPVPIHSWLHMFFQFEPVSPNISRAPQPFLEWFSHIVRIINSNFSRNFLSPSAGVAAPWQSLRTTFLRRSCDVKMELEIPLPYPAIWTKITYLCGQFSVQEKGSYWIIVEKHREWNQRGTSGIPMMLRLKKVPGAVSTGTWMRIFPTQRRDAWSQAGRNRGLGLLSFGFLQMSILSDE